MCIQSFANFDFAILAGGERMKLEQLAISSPVRKSRANAIDKLDKAQQVASLIKVLIEGKYKDAIERAELALQKYNFK